MQRDSAVTIYERSVEGRRAASLPAAGVPETPLEELARGDDEAAAEPWARRHTEVLPRLAHLPGDVVGKFVALLAQVVDVFHTSTGSPDAAVRHGVQVPVNDPMLLIPAMASVTRHLGFGVTANLTYEQPFTFARRMSTLDHLTNGRIGWNIVTGYLDSAARGMGLARQAKHDDRYETAEEYMEVMYKLWEGSWEDDAVLADREDAVVGVAIDERDRADLARQLSEELARVGPPAQRAGDVEAIDPREGHVAACLAARSGGDDGHVILGSPVESPDAQCAPSPEITRHLNLAAQALVRAQLVVAGILVVVGQVHRRQEVPERQLADRARELERHVCSLLRRPAQLAGQVPERALRDGVGQLSGVRGGGGTGRAPALDREFRLLRHRYSLPVLPPERSW